MHYLGPFHISEKVVYLDKFSVITNILQMWMVWQIVAKGEKSSMPSTKFVLGKNWTKGT